MPKQNVSIIHPYNSFHPLLKDVSIDVCYLSRTMAFDMDYLHIQGDLIVVSLQDLPDNGRKLVIKPVYMAGQLPLNS